MPEVESPDVAETHVLNNLRERCVGDLDSQMDMAVHQAEPVNTVSEPGDPLLQEIEEVKSVAVFQEDRLTVVAPQHDMVQATMEMNAWWPCHDGMLGRLA